MAELDYMLTSILSFITCIFLLFSNANVPYQQPTDTIAATSRKDPQPYTQNGKASFYARSFEGKKTASGAIFKNDKLTAAHKTLPFGTEVKVTNLLNDKSVTVVINDRGPYAKGRIIDLSRKAAQEIGMISAGKAQVLIEVVKPAEGYDISDSGIGKKKG